MRYWAIIVLLEIAAGLGLAQATLSERLRALPPSFGDNTTVSWSSRHSWVALGERDFVGYTHLRRANPGGWAGPTLRVPGRRIATTMLQDGVVVNLPELMLYRWHDGQVVAHAPISIGRITTRWHTPLGRLQVINKARNPAWNRPDWAGGGVMPPGPTNPLGDRWIGLSRPGYGLHGTNAPRSIGRTVSHGCIRLFPPHIHALFDAVSVGTPVEITYETVAVGQQDGIVYLAIFPDLYGRGTNALARVRRRMAALDLAGVVPDDTLATQARQADGVTRPILGSTLAMKVNGQPAASTVGPTLRKDSYYLPARDLAAMLNAAVTWDEATQTATFTRENRQVTVRATGDDGFIALAALFAPVRRVVEGLGGSVELSDGGLRMTLP